MCLKENQISSILVTHTYRQVVPVSVQHSHLVIPRFMIMIMTMNMIKNKKTCGDFRDRPWARTTKKKSKEIPGGGGGLGLERALDARKECKQV